MGTMCADEQDVFTKVNADLEQVACETCVKDNTAMVAKVGDLSSTSGSMHQQRTSGQAAKEEREKKKMEGREGKEKGKVRGKERRKSHREGVQRRNGKEQEREKKEKGRKEEEEKVEEVEKDVTGWTLVTRNRRQRKMVQIFVKVNGSKATPMEVNLTDDKVEDVMRRIQKDEDVYVTMHGRVLKRSERLKSYEVTDGCTIQVMSRLRGGGRHKDKKSKVEKKEGMKQEPLKNEGPAILESEKEAVIRMLEETEEYRKTIESICDGSDVEVEQALQNYRTAGREVLGWDQGQADMMECGLRWAVEARREGRRQQEEEQRRQRKQGQHPGQEESKQGKQVRFGEEQQLVKTGAENAGEPEVMGRTTEVRTGRGSAGLARQRDEMNRADETSKGKGKGNGGKGEHEGKGGGFGHSGKQQEMREREEERVRMAPNMGAGSSHPQATSDPGGREMAEEKETRGMRWADCEDDEGKEEEEREQETEEAESKKEQEAERKLEQEEGARQREMTDERPPGLEKVESEPKTQGEEQSQVESKQEEQEKRKRKSARAKESARGA